MLANPPSQIAEKVRAGLYRVGVLTISKGEKWCVYRADALLPVARFATLQEASWWAQHNQPKEARQT